MRALLFLELQSRANALRGALVRLRQPRYAIGAVAAAAYLWFLLARPYADGETRARPDPFGWLAGFLAGDLAAVVLALFLAWRWAFAATGAPLTFTEAEVAWLFPAPLEQRALVMFHLLKAQVRIWWGTLFISLLASGAGRPFWQRLLGTWIVLTFYSLHSLAGAFTRERWRRRGLDRGLRTWVVGALCVAIALLSWQASDAGQRIAASPDAIAGAAQALLAAHPLDWLLAPLRWVTAPLRASDAPGLLRTLGPALAVLALHLAWVFAAMVDFREATTAHAENLAARLRVLRAGGTWFSLRARMAHGEPFALAPRGGPALAFLWHRLISFGPWSYPRSVIATAVGLCTFAAWGVSRPELQSVVRYAGIFAAVFSLYALLLTPAFTRGSFADLFQQMDLLKAYPLRGRQIVWGALVGPAALLAAFELVMITLAALVAPSLRDVPQALVLGGWIGRATFAIPASTLVFSAQLAMQLTFPAWFAPGAHKPGIEAGGLALLFVVVPLIALLVTLVPAGVLAAVAGYAVRFVTDELAPALAFAGAAAGAVVTAEVVLMVEWLGRRYERLDLASDLRA